MLYSKISKPIFTFSYVEFTFQPIKGDLKLLVECDREQTRRLYLHPYTVYQGYSDQPVIQTGKAFYVFYFLDIAVNTNLTHFHLQCGSPNMLCISFCLKYEYVTHT